jgi:hypothetical protein
MPRKALERTNQLPYHVTARVNNREAFPLGMRDSWKIVTDELLCLNILYQTNIHAAVLMPNHLHLLLTVPEHDLGIIMNTFMSSVTRISNARSRRSGHLFGGPYFWSLIGNSRYFGHAFKYVYRNPVKAGLCSRVEQWEFSSLYGLIGSSHLGFPVRFTTPGFEFELPLHSTEELLCWLNRPFGDRAETLIQKGLRTRIFNEIRSRKDRRLETSLQDLL